MADPVNKSENENKSLKVDINVGPKSWRQRGEVIGLGMLGTAAGVGMFELGKRVFIKKVADEGLRQAASFAGDCFTSLFGK